MCDHKVIKETGKENKRSCKTFQSKEEQPAKIRGTRRNRYLEADTRKGINEDHVEQFSHAGKTPFEYTLLGEELGHTGYTQMAEDILAGTLDHEALRDDAIQAIVKQLRQHPEIQQISKPIVTVEDFKSAFKCAPDKTSPSYSGRCYQHYKACTEVSSDGLTDAQAGIHANLMSIPLLTGYCPERWKHTIDAMLEKIPGVVRSNKLRINQLLEADLNQFLRIAFARNIHKTHKTSRGCDQ
jgi:hypothetical protein